MQIVKKFTLSMPVLLMESMNTSAEAKFLRQESFNMQQKAGLLSRSNELEN